MKIKSEDFINADDKKKENVGDIRFPKLDKIDQKYKTFKAKNYGNNFTLEEMLDNFKCYSASQLHLYYDASLLRAFFAGLACGKLVILQGISGTGKTSLAYAWGKFLKHDSCIASVQPSWRDRTELFGYFNEFTKKFNETEDKKDKDLIAIEAGKFLVSEILENTEDNTGLIETVE